MTDKEKIWSKALTEVSDRVDTIDEVKCKLVSGTADISDGSVSIDTGIDRDKVVSYSVLLQRSTIDDQWWDGSDFDDYKGFDHYYSEDYVGINDAGSWYTGGSTEYRVLVWYTE